MAAVATSIVVSVSIGVLKPILGKLTALLVDECKKHKGVRLSALVDLQTHPLKGIFSPSYPTFSVQF
jgi:hypothetical protein